MVPRRRTILVVFLILAVGLVAPVAGQSSIVDVKTETTYEGIDGNSQAILVEASFSTSERISGLQIQFRETDNAFIDYEDSFNLTTSTNVNAERESRDTFTVEELRPGDTVTVSFRAYPRTLNDEQLRVARIALSAENPRTLDQSSTVTADMSDSPVFAYQDAQQQIEQWEWIRTAGMGGVGLAVLLGLVGIGGSLFMWRKKLPDAKEELKQEFVDDLNSIKGEVSDPLVEEEIENVKDEYDDSGPDIGV